MSDEGPHADMTAETLIEAPPAGPTFDDKRIMLVRDVLNAWEQEYGGGDDESLTAFEAILAHRRLIPAPLPSWAAPLDHVCIVAACSGCAMKFDDTSDEYGGVWHFDSLEEARTRIGPDEDDEEPRWQIVGDELLCRDCWAARECARTGHDWRFFKSVVDPKYSHWWCSRCSTRSETDPNQPQLKAVP